MVSKIKLIKPPISLNRKYFLTRSSSFITCYIIGSVRAKRWLNVKTWQRAKTS